MMAPPYTHNGGPALIIAQSKRGQGREPETAPRLHDGLTLLAAGEKKGATSTQFLTSLKLSGRYN